VTVLDRPAACSPTSVLRSAFARIFSRDAALVAVTTIILLLAWEAAVRLFGIASFILPAPSAILERLGTDIVDPAIWGHFLVTLTEVVSGFALAASLGLVIGAAVALVPIVEKIVYPYVLALQMVPKVAIAPLLIIWAGFGIQSKIVTAALVAFFPILVNVIAGLKTGDGKQILLMRSLKAGWWQTFAMVRLPGMLPYFFAGLEIGVTFATIGAVVGEFIGASRGLGMLIVERQNAIDVAGVFSILIFLAFMGVALNLILRLVAARYVFWARLSP
jgi:NitT/TauT family transport system permease protein